MKLILELNGNDVGLPYSESYTTPYILRKTALAVLFNNAGKIALLDVSNDKYHKLPGGGLEAGEDVITALRRECLEEVGSHIEITDEIGLTIEYKNEKGFLQISYCYIAQSVGGLVSPQYEDGELEDGFHLIWVDIDEAITLISQDSSATSSGKFICKRDLEILKEAKQVMRVK